MFPHSKNLFHTEEEQRQYDELRRRFEDERFWSDIDFDAVLPLEGEPIENLGEYQVETEIDSTEMDKYLPLEQRDSKRKFTRHDSSDEDTRDSKGEEPKKKIHHKSESDDDEGPHYQSTLGLGGTASSRQVPVDSR
ncbi:hypothetical protein PRIPAC_90081 [Pristionchus pacificus]|uniref:Uncharacterized protein n=1 Tax=Pristionchus pacificus TaxID=54126 RepID=A0A2A6CYU8_PRIPA|nr:hypothetical protein PRIPAC_90081 [Pristionchus pacificus]|eukprot:PDM83276.1 hypothetical protein PRIPAC_34908 [Pristionchus pacificus]